MSEFCLENILSTAYTQKKEQINKNRPNTILPLIYSQLSVIPVEQRHTPLFDCRYNWWS